MSQIDWYLQVNLKARHLRLLIALDDFGNLKQVAELSHVTVPAVSKALTELEKGLGLELFSRTPRGLKATPYGECLVRHARAMTIDIRHLRDELKALSSGSEGKIHIGVFPGSTVVLLPQALAFLKQRSPGTNVLLTEGTMSTLLPELWQGHLDMVVGRLPVRDQHTGFEEKELIEEPIALLTRPGHPLVSKRRLQWSHLGNYPWVLPPAGSLLRDPLERALEQHGVPMPSNYIETLSTHLARAYLLVTDAIAVMAGGVANDPAAPLAILPLTLGKLMRPRGVLWNKERGLSPGARLMVECLELAAEHHGRGSAGPSAK